MNGLWWATLAWFNAVAFGYGLGHDVGISTMVLNCIASIVCLYCLYRCSIDF